MVSQGAKCDIDPVACCEIGFEFLLGPVTLVDAVIDAHARLIGCQSTIPNHSKAVRVQGSRAGAPSRDGRGQLIKELRLVYLCVSDSRR